MNTLKTTWKAFVNENEPTAADMAAYHILRAVKAKSNDKFAVAKALIDKAFTPISNETKLANGAAPYYGVYRAIYFRPGEFYKLFEKHITDLEKECYLDLLKKLIAEFKNGIEKHEPNYMFFFVRQDLSPEQQLVQTAHVALVAGQSMFSAEANLREIYFCVIGVPNLQELLDAVGHVIEHGNKIEVFREPDIGNEMTAFCTGPIPRHKKGFLSKYKTLRFNQAD